VRYAKRIARTSWTNAAERIAEDVFVLRADIRQRGLRLDATQDIPIDHTPATDMRRPAFGIELK
jgi:hypothetical protein